MSAYLSICPYKRAAYNNLPFQLPSKKRKLEQGELKGMNITVIELLSEHLSEVDLLRFESASKGIRANAETAWKVQQKKHPKWGMCEGKDNKNKWNVCLSTALEIFLKNFEDRRPTFEKVQKLNQAYQGINQKFPLYGSFIEIELLKKTTLYPTMINDDLKQRRIQVCKLALEGWGGELLLQTLFAVTDVAYIPKKLSDQRWITRLCIVECGSLALKNNAIRVSYWVYKLLGADDYLDYDRETRVLAYQAAERGNFEALEEILSNEFNSGRLSNDDLLNEFRKMRRYPPVLMYAARVYADLHPEEIEKINAYYNEALMAYGSHQIPKHHLEAINHFRESNREFLLPKSTSSIASVPEDVSSHHQPL